ncbi:MAG TPA: DinB family protein [Bacteroidia bacterium]|nr:DinB family protein [Bacteroidia bacterium]
MKPSHALSTLIHQTAAKFSAITEEQWSHKASPSIWSKKEILGHLIDSAMNNLRRFVVTQYQQNDKIYYRQDEWVAFQEYQHAPTEEVIELWKLLNLQICRTIDNMPPEKLEYTCDTGKTAEQLHTLEFLIDDYIVHMQHHLKDILAVPASR